MGIGKKQFLSIITTVAMGEKKLHQNLESYRFKRPLKKLFDWTNAW